MRQRNRARVLVAMLIALVVFMAAKAPETVRVMISPRLGLSPLLVTVRVSIPEPTDEWSCPLIVILWPDGTESKAQSDCNDGTEFDPIVRTGLVRAGTWEVKVTVTQGINTREFRQTVEVIG